MPKFPTFPTLYDDALQLSITKLKEWGYLNPEQIKSTTLTWSSRGNEIGSISITVNTFAENHYIELRYKYKDEPRNYKVSLVSMPSNLEKGVIWYFLCPHTHKKSRKLYLIGGYFLHREAFTGCMYDSQTKSKSYREISKTFGVYFKLDDLYSQLYQKHFKKTYAGKPTKRYLQIMEQIQKTENIPYEKIERAMIR